VTEKRDGQIHANLAVLRVCQLNFPWQPPWSCNYSAWTNCDRACANHVSVGHQWTPNHPEASRERRLFCIIRRVIWQSRSWLPNRPRSQRHSIGFRACWLWEKKALVLNNSFLYHKCITEHEIPFTLLHAHNLTSVRPSLFILVGKIVIYICNSSIYQYVSSINNKLLIIKYSVVPNPIISLQPQECVWLQCVIQRDITDYLIFTQIIIKLDIPVRWNVQCWIDATLIGFIILFLSKATLFLVLPKQTPHTFIVIMGCGGCPNHRHHYLKGYPLPPISRTPWHLHNL